MNAVTPFPTGELPLEPFNRAVREVNEWRGRCLDAFTRAETAATECLLTLSAVPGRGGGIALPHLTGQRFDALAAAFGGDGPFVVEGPHALASLTRFREHASLRTMLCHGVADVTLDQKGRWTAIFRLACLRSGRVDREVLVVRESEAEQLGCDVTKKSRDLRSRLDKLASGLSASKIASV